MPIGSESFTKHQGVISARKSAGGGEWQGIQYFALKDGETARVRFLEQDPEIAWATSHRIRTAGMQYAKDVLCLDQHDDGTPCPSCMSENKEIRGRSTKGYLNIIWRGTEDGGYTRAPIYKLNSKGYPEKDQQNKKIVTGFEDSVWLWKCSKTVLELIWLKDAAYKGLMSRDFVVSRKGATLDNTVYAIEPAVIDGGQEPMTVADASLSQKRFDVQAITTPGTYEEMVAMLSGQQTGGNVQTQSPTQEQVFSGAVRSSAFQR